MMDGQFSVDRISSTDLQRLIDQLDFQPINEEEEFKRSKFDKCSRYEAGVPHKVAAKDTLSHFASSGQHSFFGTPHRLIHH